MGGETYDRKIEKYLVVRRRNIKIFDIDDRPSAVHRLPIETFATFF